MNKDMTVQNQNGYLTAERIQADANLIQKVMKAVMKDKIHYGTVPGCGPKPTLLKPGAEKILSTFRIAADPEITDLSTDDCKKYRVRAKGVHTNGDGVEIYMGHGVGVCSSDEEKYKWRKAVNKAEFEETPEDRRRNKWRKSYNGGKDYQEMQVRTQAADLENTILKMAKKRALVDLCLTATAASDCFNQDIEDLPAEYIADEETHVQDVPAMPKPKSAAKEEPKTEVQEETPEARPVPKDFLIMTAKYDGICKSKECGQEIKAGSQIAYSKAKGNFHPDCAA